VGTGLHEIIVVLQKEADYRVTCENEKIQAAILEGMRSVFPLKFSS
jgi:hypothetical protein